jgi:hypothetical protein
MKRFQNIMILYRTPHDVIKDRQDVVVVVCGFRGASASKAICAYLQMEGNKILECMHYFQEKCFKYDS